MDQIGAPWEGEVRQYFSIHLERLLALQGKATYAEIADSRFNGSDLGNSRNCRNVDEHAGRAPPVLQHRSVCGAHTTPGVVDVRGLMDHKICPYQERMCF